MNVIRTSILFTLFMNVAMTVVLADLLFTKVVMVARRHIIRNLYFVNFVHACGHGKFILNVNMAIYPNVTTAHFFYRIVALSDV
jgi:predicted dinucleotide-utilizing enzyme